MGQTLELWFRVARGRSQIPPNWKKFIPWLGTVFSQQQWQKPQKGHGGFRVHTFEILLVPREFKETVLSWPFSSLWKSCSRSQNLFLKTQPMKGSTLSLVLSWECGSDLTVLYIPLCLCVAGASNLDYLPFRERAHSSCRIPLLWVRTDVIHFLLGCVRRSAWDKSVFWMR